MEEAYEDSARIRAATIVGAILLIGTVLCACCMLVAYAVLHIRRSGPRARFAVGRQSRHEAMGHDHAI